MTDPCEPHFVLQERTRQAAFFEAYLPGEAGFERSAFRLAPANRLSNLNPDIHDIANRYFRRQCHRLASACRSWPLVTGLLPEFPDASRDARPEMLPRLVQSALGDLPEMLKVEKGPDGEPWFVGFEWIGRTDYLNEWPRSAPPM
ncbi:hypothetical protein [Mesorhizobium sp. M1006]|uniref:hypothetical protein n=1 Tax=unclassified Mesorhizobium TaxID=325217 RepID=UPI00333A4517